jgi:hypothetical protein
MTSGWNDLADLVQSLLWDLAGLSHYNDLHHSCAGTAVPTVRFECQKRAKTLIRVNPRDYLALTQSLFRLNALEAIEGIDQLRLFQFATEKLWLDTRVEVPPPIV